MSTDTVNMEQQVLRDVTEQLIKDPRVQEQALEFGKEQARVGAKKGIELGQKGLLAFKSYVEAGPEGIQILCLLGGCVTFVVGVLNLLDLLEIFNPFKLLMNIYTVIFGIITICVEADVDRLEETPVLNLVARSVEKVQEYLHENAKFLTLLGGRGIFYIGVGLVMASRCHSPLCLFFIAGAANCVTGVLCICMYFGHVPNFKKLHDKAKEVHKEVTGRQSEFDRAEAGYSDDFQKQIPTKTKKEMNALLKQATRGDLNPRDEPRPQGLFNMAAKAEWEARKKLLGTTTEEAKQLFVIRAKVENAIKA
eukprot:GEMP01038501.1.p1 GENE.GEMP01038501.1~~GEMP01038501.1.p1  ORF type:complete len:308 (+),score=64.55 GEMP01038501.1:95-1018(+)